MLPIPSMISNPNFPDIGQESELVSLEHAPKIVLTFSQSTRFWLQTVTVGKGSLKKGKILITKRLICWFDQKINLLVCLNYMCRGMECNSCFDRIGEEIVHDRFDAVQGGGEANEKDDHPDEPTNSALGAPGMIQSSNTFVYHKLWDRRTILLRKKFGMLPVLLKKFTDGSFNTMVE